VKAPDGEYRLGEATIFSAGRLRRLLDAGILDPSVHGENCYRVIQDRYCKLLRIDPDDMLVIRVEEPIAKMYQARIQAVLEELPESIPIEERIWTAHQKGLIGVSPLILNFVKSRFFPSLA
jgi:hypothetical protein